MTNTKENIRNLAQECYELTRDHSPASYYFLSYWWIETNFGLDMKQKINQDELREVVNTEFCDLIQTIDFDDTNEKILILIWEVGKMKKNNTNSQYPTATWKDLLRATILYLHYDGLSYKEAIWQCLYRFTKPLLKEVLENVESYLYSEELKVDFSNVSFNDLWKVFDDAERKTAVREILQSNIVIEELYDKDHKCCDKVVLMDYSIKSCGYLLGWHYGVEWDLDSDNNRNCITRYVNEMTKNDKE